MFRRDFFASLGVLPFFGFAPKKKDKVQVIELKNRTLFINIDKKYIFKEIMTRTFGQVTYHFNEDGQISRDDGPAVESSNGYKAYWKDGVLIEYHRDSCDLIRIEKDVS